MIATRLPISGAGPKFVPIPASVGETALSAPISAGGAARANRGRNVKDFVTKLFFSGVGVRRGYKK